MTVFKTFLRVLNQCKIPVILYTVFLIAFGGVNMQTSDNTMGFTASRPDILIINQDKEAEFSKGLEDYLTTNCNIVDVADNDQARNDALFYRDVSYIVTIPEHYGEDLLAGNDPEIEIKSTGDAESTYAEMLLSRYINVAKTYAAYIDDQTALTEKVAETLQNETQVEVTSKLDTGSLTKAAFYYNFASYSLLAGCVYVICLILSSFRAECIRKRTIISSMDYKKHNRQLLLSNGLFAIALWVVYVLLSLVMIGDTMLTRQGLLMMANSFAFTICAVTIAFFIGNLVSNKNAVNGIVNVVALGSSFLCGAFVPVEMLPDAVLGVAHILPSYWYIQSNETLKNMETVNWEALKPVLFNMGVVLAFAILFVILANVVTRAKRKIG